MPAGKCCRLSARKSPEGAEVDENAPSGLGYPITKWPQIDLVDSHWCRVRACVRERERESRMQLEVETISLSMDLPAYWWANIESQDRKEQKIISTKMVILNHENSASINACVPGNPQ